MKTTSLTLTLIAALGLLFAQNGSISAQATRLVVASGLDNPRGLGFGADGALYVVEAGRGGAGPCVPNPEGGAPRCYGATGAVTRILALGDQRRVVVGLPSVAAPGGAGATGPHDIAFGLGSTFLTVGFGGDPAQRAPLEAAGIRMGRLVRVESNGQWTDVVDIGAFEASANPDGTLPDSNPYGLQVTSDGVFVADAGANAVFRVTPAGVVSTLAVFPARPVGPIPASQSVPTTIVGNPFGGYLVSELTGFPFPVGGARVFQVPAGGGTPVPVATGFTNVIDIATDPAGGGWVLEFDADGILGPGNAGRLIRVNANGTQTVRTDANLTLPGGIAIGPDGAIYVTNFSVMPGLGEVVRLTP